MVKVFLTPQQHRIFILYTTTDKTQKEIAKEVFGKESSQGIVSNTLKAISKKLGDNLTSYYNKRKDMVSFDIDY